MQLLLDFCECGWRKGEGKILLTSTANAGDELFGGDFVDADESLENVGVQALPDLAAICEGVLAEGCVEPVLQERT